MTYYLIVSSLMTFQKRVRDLSQIQHLIVLGIYGGIYCGTLLY